MKRRLESWYISWRGLGFYPRTYRLHTIDVLLLQLRILSFVFLAAIISFILVPTPTVAAIISGLWLFLVAVYIIDSLGNNPGISVFYSKRVGAPSSPAPPRYEASSFSHNNIYYAIAKNYGRLEAFASPEIDPERFVFRFRHGLVIPWSSSLSTELFHFILCIHSNGDQLTDSNGFDDATNLTLEVESLLSDIRLAHEAGVDFALVIGGPRCCMEEFDGQVGMSTDAV